MKKIKLMLIGFITAVLLMGATQVKNSSSVKMHVINVGQGDVILIQTGNENILVDGGN